MRINELKKRNLYFIFLGFFFFSISIVLVKFFLPFFLKERGFTILEIGIGFTIALGIANLLGSKIFAHFQRYLKLKSTLGAASILAFFSSFILFLFPNFAGAVFSKSIGSARNLISRISVEVSIQHNSSKNNKRKISSYYLFVSGVSFVVGLALSVFLINKIGFMYSFLIFSLLSILSICFYFNVKEETRFKAKTKKKLGKISKKIRLLMFANILFQAGLSASMALVITFLVVDKFQGSVTWIAFLFIGLYSSITLTTFFTKNVLDKFKLEKTAILGMIILLLSAVIVIFSQNLYVIFCAMVVEGIGAGIWVPSKEALYWKNTSPSMREKVTGEVNGYRNFIQIISPLLGAWLVTVFGILSPFFLKGILAIFSIGVYIYIIKKL